MPLQPHPCCSSQEYPASPIHRWQPIQNDLKYSVALLIVTGFYKSPWLLLKVYSFKMNVIFIAVDQSKKDVWHFPLAKCRYPQYVPRVPGMSPNRPNGSYFTIPQSVNDKHSFLGAPASLYKQTNSAPDPSSRKESYCPLLATWRQETFFGQIQEQNNILWITIT